MPVKAGECMCVPVCVSKQMAEVRAEHVKALARILNYSHKIGRLVAVA